jgi:hypothetical protein
VDISNLSQTDEIQMMEWEALEYFFDDGYGGDKGIATQERPPEDSACFSSFHLFSTPPQLDPF